jgi:hypothetical protein
MRTSTRGGPVSPGNDSIVTSHELTEPVKNKRTLGIASIGLMTAAAVVTSLRGLPLLAKEEMTMFAYRVLRYLLSCSSVIDFR